MTVYVSDVRRDFRAVYRLQRLGAFVLRDDAAAPPPVWAAQCAAETAHTPDPLSAPLTVRRGAHALAGGLGIGRLRLTRFGYLPPDPIPPAAGPAAPVLEGLPAPATAQAHPPAQPDPILCHVCEGSGFVPVTSFAFHQPDEYFGCDECGGTGCLPEPDEPDLTPAQQLARALVACVHAIDDFYYALDSSDVDLHEGLKLSCRQARTALSESGYPLSRWPF